jgi:hypothetical protein
MSWKTKAAQFYRWEEEYYFQQTLERINKVCVNLREPRKENERNIYKGSVGRLHGHWG